ncbi:MAG: integration host factor subunit alpha [Gammaproteobacteria bacterium]|nr:integration host factor subunit alpha [Gammaproteobacteria bacterium]
MGTLSENNQTLTRADLARLLKDELGLNEREARDVVATFFEEIITGLEGNTSVKMQRFGTFGTRDKKERPGRNLKTGEVATVSARRVVTFRPSSMLKERITEYAGPGIE